MDRRTFIGRLAISLGGLVGAKTQECKGSSEKLKGNTTVDRAIEAYTCHYGWRPWGILVSIDVFNELSQGGFPNRNRWLIRPTRQGGRPTMVHGGVVIICWFWLNFKDEYHMAMPVSYDEACDILWGPGKNMDSLTLHYHTASEAATRVKGAKYGRER